MKIMYADTIYFNGDVIPMTDPLERKTALAVKDGKIIAVGNDEEMKQYGAFATKWVDLKGQCLIPGFYDAHSHFVEVGTGKLIYENLNSPPYGNVHEVKDCLDILKEKSEKALSGNSIIGAGYDHNAVKEKRHLSKKDLDQVSTENPVIVDHVTSHFMYVNTKALEIAGINKDTPDPIGGHIQKDANGEPNGILEENAVDLIWNNEELSFLGTREEKIRGLELASDYYAEHGYTTANQGSLGGVDILEEGLERGFLKIRCVLWCPPNQIVEYEEKGVVSHSDMIVLGGGKEFQDGSIQCGTAYLTKPYYTQINGHSKEYCGEHIWKQEELTDWVRKVHNAGKPMHIHCNGDAAIDEVLNAYEQAQKENPKEDIRHVLVHAQATRMDQLERMKELNVIPSFYVPAIYLAGDEQYSTYLGPERCNTYNPIKTALKMGLHPTFHTDCPVMPADPLMSLQTAVTRKTKSGKVIGEEECLTIYEALLCSTLYSAYQNHEEDVKGSLEVGKFADFVVLDRNPLDTPAEELSGIQVLKTIVSDKVIYEKK